MKSEANLIVSRTADWTPHDEGPARGAAVDHGRHPAGDKHAALGRESRISGHSTRAIRLADDRTHHPDALPQRGRDACHLHRQGAGLSRAHRHRRRSGHRRQRLDRRQPADRRARRAPASSPVALRGYGAALAGGIEAARGRFVIMGDADDSYDFANLDAFVAALRAGNELVMGNRFKGGIAPGAMPWHHSYIGNPVLSFARPAVLPHQGFRLPLRPARLRPRRDPGSQPAHHRHGVRLRNAGQGDADADCSVAEVPTTLKQGRPHPPAASALLPRRLAASALPAAVLAALAVPLSGAGAAGDRAVPRHAADPRTGAASRRPSSSTCTRFLAAAMCILVGLQAVSFAIIGRRFASRYGFIPRSATFDRVLEALTLERILLVAVAARSGRPRRARLGLHRNGPRASFGPLESADHHARHDPRHDGAGRRLAAGDVGLHGVDDRHPAHERASREAPREDDPRPPP